MRVVLAVSSVLSMILSVSCFDHRKIETNILLSLDNYREAKSKDYAKNGGLWGGEEVMKLRHQEFDAIASNIKDEIYIIKNEYESNIIKRDLDYEKISGIKNVFEIKGVETIIGKIENNAISYFNEPEKRIAPYLIAVQDDSYLLLFDVMYTAHYVLEKDVPILLERLSGISAPKM